MKKQYFFMLFCCLISSFFSEKLRAQCPVTITPTPTSVCIGATTTLTASGATTYTWSSNAGSATTASVSIIPLSNSVYTVTATTGTCVATQTVAIIVNALPSLTVVATPTAVCPGASSTLSASGATSYTWDANAGGGNAATASVTPSAYTTYTLTGSNGTCTATSVVDVAVSDTPAISLVSNPQNVCAGGTATLSATGASSYTWSSGGASTSTTVVTPAAATVYTVTGANSAGCTSTQTVAVGVVPFISVFISANPSGVCAGGSTTLTASGASSYTWDANAGSVNTATAAVSPFTGTIYTVNASSGTCIATQTVYVPVVSSFSASLVATPTLICAGQTATLTASGGSSYSWSPNAGGGNGQVKTVTPFANSVYQVTATNGICTSTQTVAIQVNPAPTMTLVADPVNICVGGTSTLTASGAVSYTWSANAGGVTTASTTVSPPSTTVYSVTGSNGTCTSVQTINVNIVPFLSIPAAANPTSVCSAGTTTLTASGANTYTWSTAAGGVNTPTAVATPTVNTTYTVTGSSGSCVASQTVSVSITPSLAISVSPPVTSVCYGQTAILTVNGASSYTWSANAGSATTQTVAVTPLSNTVYTVTASSGACVATQTALVTVITNTLDIVPPVGTTTLFCTGVPYQFGAVDTTTGGYSVQYYNWSVSPSSSVTVLNGSCTTCNGPTFTFDTTGTYTLSVVANLNSGCLDSTTYTVTVVQTPTVVTTPFAPTVCEGGPVGTMIYVTGAGTLGTYSWTPMINIATQYAAGDSILINPPNAGVYNYTVVGTNAAGCPSLPKVVTATVFPAPTFTALAVDDSICSYLNTAVMMVASSSVTSANATYTWTCGPNGNLGTPFSQTSAVSPIYGGSVDTTFVYYANVTVPGCPAYPTYTVDVVVIPTPTVSLVSDTVYNCNKMGDTLKVTSNPAAGVTFTWTPNYNISSIQGSSVFVHPNFQEYYYVTPVTTTGTMTCIGKTDSILVMIGDTTNTSITVQYDIVCKGAVDTLIANPPRTQLNGTYQYYWTMPSTTTGTTTVTGDTLVITPMALGTYTLNVRGTCVNRQTAEVVVAVNNCTRPVVQFTETADTICRRKCVTYNDITQQYTVRPLWFMWVFTVQLPQVSINCVGPGASGCIIKNDTVYYASTDSSAIPKIKVCYYQTSLPSQPFPIEEYVSHDPNLVYTQGTANASLTSSATHSITIYDGPLALATKTQTINLGDAVQISGQQSSGTLSTLAGYSWSPPTALSCTNCVSPMANPSVTTQYVLTVTDKNGCTDTSSITIFVDLTCFDPFVPSAFSPNGDQENDVLYVRSNCLKNFTFRVFDRWGEKVFETENLEKGWDGSFRGAPMNAGVFMYTLEGYQTTGGKEIRQKGNITLVK